MSIEIIREPLTALADYAAIPIAFRVDSVIDVTTRDDPPGGYLLSERMIDTPYEKDYDAIEGEGPMHWERQFAMTHWGLFGAWLDGRRVGGAAVVFDTPAITMLEGRRDLAVLWDIRIAPDARGRGIGALLFRAAEEWAIARGCRQLKVETQNINAPACRFYARQGCVLRAVHHSAYPELPEEVQLLWYKDLAKT